ncbi:ferritin family protein [candidate division WOR-3 bacterium]|nr:ferritin family protein [candidate division WOR-3 bacterium]
MFKPAEIMQFAIRIEENGELFYTTVAQQVASMEVKELFKSLASEEAKHKATYEKLLSTIETYDPPEMYPGEYYEYLRAYADNHIFPLGKVKKEIATITTAEAALKFAMAREIESILYYQELKNIVPENEKGKIDAIIEEERRHYVKLSGCKDSVCVNK